MTNIEKRDLIEVAGKYIKSGANTATIKDEKIQKMMKQIAANAVSIGLYNFNRYVIGNIADGDFTTIKRGWKDARLSIVKCLAIINNEGEDLNIILGLDEIDEAINYTIYEQTEESRD